MATNLNPGGLAANTKPKLDLNAGTGMGAAPKPLKLGWESGWPVSAYLPGAGIVGGLSKPKAGTTSNPAPASSAPASSAPTKPRSSLLAGSTGSTGPLMDKVLAVMRYRAGTPDEETIASYQGAEPRSLLDFLAAAQDTLSSMYGNETTAYDTTAVDNRIAAARQNTAEVDDLMRGAYEAAANRMRADRDATVAAEAATANNIETGTNEAIQDLNDSGAALQAARDRDAALSGQTGAYVGAGVARDAGGTAYGDRDIQEDIASAVTKGATDKRYSGGNYNADRTLLGGYVAGTERAGLDTRQANQRSLLSQLAALEDERAAGLAAWKNSQQSLRQQRASDGLSLAAQLYDEYRNQEATNYDRWNAQRQWENTLQTQGFDRAVAISDAKQSGVDSSTIANALKIMESATFSKILGDVSRNKNDQWAVALQLAQGGTL